MSLFSGENPHLGDETTVNGSKPQTVAHISIPLSATSASSTVFVAPTKYQILQVRTVFGTASTSGTVQVEKLSGTTANGSGVAVLAVPAALSGAANTVVSAAPSAAGLGVINAGDRIGLVIAGTMTGLANGFIQISAKRL